MPTACAAAPSRVRSSVAKAIDSPLPSAPIRFSAGTRTSSKTGEPVGEPLIPSLCSSLGTENPGRSFSTTNALIRGRPSSDGVRANTT